MRNDRNFFRIQLPPCSGKTYLAKKLFEQLLWAYDLPAQIIQVAATGLLQLTASRKPTAFINSDILLVVDTEWPVEYFKNYTIEYNNDNFTGYKLAIPELGQTATVIRIKTPEFTSEDLLKHLGSEELNSFDFIITDVNRSIIPYMDLILSARASPTVYSFESSQPTPILKQLFEDVEITCKDDFFSFLLQHGGNVFTPEKDEQFDGVTIVGYRGVGLKGFGLIAKPAPTGYSRESFYTTFTVGFIE